MSIKIVNTANNKSSIKFTKDEMIIMFGHDSPELFLMEVIMMLAKS